MIGIIAAVSKNGIIGIKNKLPFNYPEDLAHFKKVTGQSTVIMGRNTFESIGRPLPQRRNIVVTKSTIDKIETATSLADAVKMCQSNKDIWLIGGFSIYQQGMQVVDKILLTITPDIINEDEAIRFPWINPCVFDLKSINKLQEGSQLLLASYQKK